MRGRERERKGWQRERERIREGGNMFVCVCVCAYKRCIHVVSLLHKVEWCSSVMNPRAILRITTN